MAFLIAVLNGGTSACRNILRSCVPFVWTIFQKNEKKLLRDYIMEMIFRFSLLRYRPAFFASEVGSNVFSLKLTAISVSYVEAEPARTMGVSRINGKNARAKRGCSGKASPFSQKKPKRTARG